MSTKFIEEVDNRFLGLRTMLAKEHQGWTGEGVFHMNTHYDHVSTSLRELLEMNRECKVKFPAVARALQLYETAIACVGEFARKELRAWNGSEDLAHPEHFVMPEEPTERNPLRSPLIEYVLRVADHYGIQAD